MTESLMSLVRLSAMACGSIVIILGLVRVFRRLTSYDDGSGSIVSGILYVLVGAIICALPMVLSLAGIKPPDLPAIVIENNTEEPIEQAVAEEPVVEQVAEAPKVEEPTVEEKPTEQPTVEVPVSETVSSTNLTDEEINTKWTYALKHNYEFYYKDVKRNPDYIDKSLYRLEFDDTNRVVRLYDK